MPDIKSLLYGPIGSKNAILIIIFAIWSVFWKGISLWKASKNDQRYWFVFLLILNTVGITDIIYLSLFQKNRKSTKKVK